MFEWLVVVLGGIVFKVWMVTYHGLWVKYVGTIYDILILTADTSTALFFLS